MIQTCSYLQLLLSQLFAQVQIHDLSLGPMLCKKDQRTSTSTNALQNQQPVPLLANKSDTQATDRLHHSPNLYSLADSWRIVK